MDPSDTFLDRFSDNLGPEKIIHVYDPKTGMKGIVVIDNVAMGPAIGGVRIAPDVTTEEVFRLARAMTLKNAAAGLRHGGGKAGIVGDPHLNNKEPLIRAFARKIKSLHEYIPGPDMGTDENCMALIHDEIGRCVGLPRVLGGIPLDEIGATGYGLAVVAELAMPHAGLPLKGATVAIQGFGNVGQHAAKFFEEQGAILVAACDSRGTIFSPKGLDVQKLIDIKEREGTVLASPDGIRLTTEEVISVECNILIPAARPDAITRKNLDSVRARVIIEGANIPITEEAELTLHDRGILCIPDFIANAGGVICGAVEFHGGSEQEAFRTIHDKISRNTREMLQISKEEKISPRQAATLMATDRVLGAMAFRR